MGCLYIVKLEDGKPVTEARPVSNSIGADIHHRTAVTNEGLWIVWQSDRGGRFEIVALLFNDNHKNDLQIVSDSKSGNWHPSITSDTLGNVHIAWDTYDGEAFNVRLRSYRNGKWEKTINVTNSSAFEGRTDIVSDHQNRVWIVWEEGGQNWGKPFRGVKTKQDIGPLHRFRLIQMALLGFDGSLQIMNDPIPMPAVTKALSRPNREKVGAFYERSKLSVDRFGHLWIFYRHFCTPWLGISPRHHLEKEWGLYARCYTSDGWSSLKKMSVGQGDGLQRLELASHDNGVAAVWTTGKTRRHDNKPPRGLKATIRAYIKRLVVKKPPRGLITATVTTPVRKAGNPPLKQLKTSKPRKKNFLKKDIESVTIGNKNYYLFYGDLHRHTDLSLCRMPTDGTLDDAYRYAIEVAKLDFMGITDHSRDIALGNHLSQLWWRNRKAVYRYQLLDDGKMHFVPFYAYERSHDVGMADHNVISLRNDMLRPYTYPLPQFWKELDNNTITIPHTPFRQGTWGYHDDLFRPLVEIFQGGRNISSEKHVHQALHKGYHLGFIASSDHMSTSASYACVWAEDSTRESIFRALQARRTFAATDKIWLMLQSNDHLMGEIIEPAGTTQLKLEVRGTAPIQSINLILDGEINKTWTPNKRSITLDINLDSTGKNYAYFHLVQIDGNEAWSSPIWFDNVGTVAN